MDKIADYKINKWLFYLSFLGLGGLLLYIAFFSVAHYGGNDSWFHFLHTKGAQDHSELFIHHWGKPLFILFSYPFAFFGVIGIKIFNVLIMLGSALLAYSICNKLKFKFSFLVIPFVLLMPVYLPFAQSNLTEPLFGFVALLGTFFFFNRQYILSAIIISFIIFTRSEGLSFLLAYAIAFIITRQWKAIPFLSFGFIVYGFVGLSLVDNFWWFITDNPYTGASDIYGSGDLLHYFKEYKEITGTLAALFIIIGLIFWGLNVSTKRAHLFSPFSLVILLPVGLFIAGHSYVWWKGLNGSLGLIRVMGGITPMLAIVALYGVSSFINVLSNFKLSKWIIYGVVLIIPIQLYNETYWLYRSIIPYKENEIDMLVNESIDWLNNNQLTSRKTYVYKPEYLAYYHADHFDKANSRVVEAVPHRKEPSKGLNKGDIVVWDGHIGPNEGRLPLSRLINDPNFRLLKGFSPKEDIIVLGGNKYSIQIFERL